MVMLARNGYAPTKFREYAPRIPVDVPRWVRVTNVVDNRLRLLRLQAEGHMRRGEFAASKQYIASGKLKNELLLYLDLQYYEAKGSSWWQEEDPHRERIGELRALVALTIISGAPRFEAIYQLMGVPVPKSVK
jgi:hypothetical protein